MSDAFTIEGILALSVDPSSLGQVTRVLKPKLDEINKNLAKGLTNAFKEGARAGDKTFTTLERDLAAFAASAKARLGVLRDLKLDPNLLAGADEQFRKLIRLQDTLHTEFVAGFNDPKALRGIEATFNAIRTGLSKEIGIAQSLTRDISRARLVGLEGAEKRATTAANTQAQAQAQRSLAITKAGLQQRVAVTRLALDTIGRMEKALVSVITGAARTATSAVSKIWDSTVGSVRRSFSERHTVISGGLKNETKLFQQAAVVQQRAQQGLLGIGIRQAAFLGGGLGVIGALKSTFTIGADFTQGLRVLQAQLGLTEEEMQKVRKASIDLGNDIQLPGVSALDASTAINLLAKQFAGLGAGAVGAATDASKGVLQLEIATKASAEEAARLVGSSVNVFGIAATEATKVADQISQAIAKSAGVSVTDFSQAFTQAATVFSQFVTPAEGATESLIDFNTAIAALAKGGLIGSDAGTSLRSFFIQANKGTDESNAALAELTKKAGESGTAFFDLAGKARPFTQTLDILRRGLAGLTDEQKTSTLQTIFGSDAIRAASILTGQSTAEYQKLRDSIAASEGAATRFAAAQSGGLRRAFDAIISSVQTLQIQLFTLADKFLGPIALRFADFFSNLISGGGGFEVLRKGLIGVAAGLAAVAAVRVGVEVLGLLAKVLPLLLTPFGALAIAAAGLGAAFAISQGSFDKFRETLTKVGVVLQARVVPVLLRLKDLAATAVKPLVERVKSLGQTVVQFLSPAVVVLRRFFDEIAFGVKLLSQGNFTIALSQFKNIGKEIQSIFSDLVGKIPFDKIGALLSTNLGRALSGAGIGAVAGGALAGPLGAALGAAFGAAVGLAIPRIRAAISQINPAQLFGKFLEGVRVVGQKIAQFLFDKKTLTAAAGLVGAAIAIGAQFVSGFISGLLSKLGDIADVGALILNTLFAQNAVVKAIAALALLFRRQLVGLFTSSKAGSEAGAVIGKNIVDGAQKGILANVKVLGTTLKAGLASAGKAAASGLSIALAAGLSGSALGDARGALETGLGLAGLGGAAAQAFALGGGQATGAALAAGTVGVGLLTAALSANAKKAAEARARVAEYASAVDLAGSNSTAAATAISGVFAGNLKQASDDVKQGFIAAGLSAEDLQTQIASGNGEAILKALVDRQKELEKATFKTVDESRAAAAAYNDLRKAISFTKGEIKSIDASAEKSKLNKDLFSDATAAAIDFDARVQGIGASLRFLRDHADQARVKAKELFKQQQVNALQAQLDATRAKAEAIGTKADESRRKLRELLAGVNAPTTPQAATDQQVVQVPNVAADVQAGVEAGASTALGGAKIRTTLDGFRQDLAATFETALTSADPGAALAQSLQAITSTIALTPDVSPEARQLLLDQLNAEFAVAQTQIPVGVEIAQGEAQKAALDAKAAADAALLNNPAKLQLVIDSQKAADDAEVNAKKAQVAAQKGLEGGQALGSGLMSSVGTGITSGTPEAAIAAATAAEAVIKAAKAKLGVASPSTVFTAIGHDITAGLARGITAGRGIVTAAVQGLMASISAAGRVNFNAFNRIGAQIVQGIAAGIRAATSLVVKTVTATAGSLVQTMQVALKIGSPSKVFYGIGQDTMQGFIDGFRSMETEATSIATSLADSVVASFQTTAQKAAELSSNTFADLLNSVFNEADLNRAVVSAQNGITTAFNGLRSTVTSNAEALFSATAKPAGERTALERLLVGDTFVSLDPNSALGVANREAIASAAEAVQNFAVSLLRQGQNVSQVTEQIRAYRAQLISLAGSLGLTTDGVVSLITQLGLGDDRLTQFITDAQRAQELLQTILAPAAQNPVGTPATVSPVNQFFTNNFNTPFDDPEAVSLSVANRIARLVRT